MSALKLEVGKTYVDNSGNKVRILEVGINYPNKDYSTVGVVTLTDGTQTTRSYTASGMCGSPGGLGSIKKEYVEPIKVRVWVYKHGEGKVRSFSAAQGRAHFAGSQARLFGPNVTMISDQIIEVEPQ